MPRHGNTPIVVRAEELARILTSFDTGSCLFIEVIFNKHRKNKHTNIEHAYHAMILSTFSLFGMQLINA